MIDISLQTITWGDPQHHQFEQIFSIASQAGFGGVEIGFRRLGQLNVDVIADLLAKNGLRLSASHVGGNLADAAQASSERAALERVLDYLVRLDSQYLLYSGLDVDNDSDLDSEIARIGALAEDCARKGIRLLYHNHNWEFVNSRHIWDRLQAASIDALGFAPDLGWAVKGGQDMGELLEEIGSAVKVLHFKDFQSWADGQNTCHLGTGIIDFTPAWAWLAEQSSDHVWITAEQDHALDADKACLHNGAYLTDRATHAGFL